MSPDYLLLVFCISYEGHKICFDFVLNPLQPFSEIIYKKETKTNKCSAHLVPNV